MPAATMTSDASLALPAPRRTGFVPVTSIVRDERVNTRPVDDAWVARRVDSFRPEALGLPAVSLRTDDTYVVLDGQNRIALIRASGWNAAHPELECQIYEGLDLAQEAGLFILLNDGRAPKTIHKFLARITQGDPIAVQIAVIVQRCGWRVEVNPAIGVITAVATLERIHTKDLRKNKGQTPVALENTLTTITEAWQHTWGGQHEAIIGGIGLLYVTHGPAIDAADLTAKLADYQGGPAELRSKAQGLRAYSGGSVANCVAELVTKLYNKGKQTRKLPALRK